jgi:hypothetical protein
MDMLRGGWGPGMMGNGMGAAAGTSYAAETEAIAAAFTTPPTTARKNLMDACVVSLKSAGVWTKLDVLHVDAAADSQAALINWKAPGTFNGTAVNSPTFTADNGFTGNASSYIDTSFNPATAPSPKYIQDSAMFSAWSLSDINAGGVIYTIRHPAGWGFLQPRSSGNCVGVINGASGSSSVANANGSGLFACDRASSTNITFYRNATSLGSPANTSTAVSSGSIQFQYTWTGIIAAGSIGSSLNSTEQTAFYNALRTYMTGVGVP